MILGDFRSFLGLTLNSLGYKQWEDGFNNNNIPSTLLHKSYHVQVGRISSGPANHLHHTFIYPVKISVYFKGYRNPSLAIDDSLRAAQDILGGILATANRLQTDGLKDIRPGFIETFPLSQSNDNAVVLEIELEGYFVFNF